MNPIWINNAQTHRLNGAFLTLRGQRTPTGLIRLGIWFSTGAVAALDLKAGNRMLIGLEADQQLLVLRPTLFGGTALVCRAGRSDVSMAPTLPTLALPRPQAIPEEAINRQGDDIVLPFEFDASKLLPGFQMPALRRAA